MVGACRYSDRQHIMAKQKKQKQRKKSIVRRFAEYMLGGALFFWIGYGLFALAYSVFGWNWFWSKVLGDVVGRTVNYLVQRYLTFNDTSKAEATHMGRYWALSVVSIGLDYLIVGGLKALGVTPYFGQFISSWFFTIWNYLWYKYWVFPEKRPLRRRKKKN